MAGAQQSERSKVVGVRVLEAQPDLAEGLEPDDAALARRHAVAVLESLPVGPWVPAGYDASPGSVGLLVVDGLLARELRVAGRWCSELLGSGDLLRPWDYEDAGIDTLRSASSWSVLEPARIALLDERFARTACRWPELMSALVGRTLRRSRWMTIMLAISNMTRIDERVVGLMWHLADRWGRVTGDGVLVPVPLTHEMIGKLVGAHRPSVTSALGDLQRSGTITRREDGWLLHGDPPAYDDDNGGERRQRAIDPTLALALPALAATLVH